MRKSAYHHHWLFAVLVAVFFLCARAGSFAHAASYGSAPHNHESKICMLSVVVDEAQDDLALPPSEITLAIPTLKFGFDAQSAHTLTSCTPVLTRVRGPPAHQ